MANTLIPAYLDIDFDTMKTRLQDLLSKTDTFKDYNYAGSNITLLIELVSYLNALTTYYGNKIAQNQYIETADLYETVHMLSRLGGYYPKGYISAEGNVTITIESPSAEDGTVYVSPGDTVYIPAWKKLYCSGVTDDDGNVIYYTNTTALTETIPASATFPYSLTTTLHVKQGEVVEYTDTYTGDDLVDYKLYLPQENFDYDVDLDDDYPSIEVTVNGSDPWTRLSDFYDDIDELSEISTAYMFKYDKYKRYYIEFSSIRTVPEKTDVINVKVIKTTGADGNVGAKEINEIDSTELLYNSTTLEWINNDLITVENADSAQNGADPETVEEIKYNALTATHTQYRNVTKTDYIRNLETRSDVVVANVWGEQEVAPSGSFQEYNKVYVSLIPSSYGVGTITLNGGTVDYPQPDAYSDSWKTTIGAFLEPYKMICTWEEFTLPQFVYFNYTIGIKLKRTYDFSTVAEAVKNKLIYYFDSTNREFGETISFTDVMEYLLDMDNVSADDSFTAVNGVQTLIIRDINVLSPVTTVYEPNESGNYPQYTTSAEAGYDNKLRHILLGYNQFPVLDSDTTTIVEET